MDKFLIILCLAWISYFLLHSLMASLTAKRWVANTFPNIMPWYRLIFNSVALITLIPINQYSNQFSGGLIWVWSGSWLWLSHALALLAIIGFIHSLKFYDMQEFFGFRQIREKNTSVTEQEHLKISPYHRYVRHPWYFFAIILIWTRDMNSAWLLSSILLTAYFIFGSRLEDRKLITYFGEPYALYKTKVSGIFPLPWKTLNREEATRLQKI